jgi:hypothetical protein
VAAGLQREAADKKAIVGAGRCSCRTPTWSSFGEHDHTRMTEYDEPLRAELASMVREHADEQGWSFVGKVRVAFEKVDELDTASSRVRSAVAADAPVAREHRPPASGAPGSSCPRQRHPGAHRPAHQAGDRDRPRGRRRRAAARHRRLPRPPRAADRGTDVRLADMRSTNGTLLNGSA